MQFEEQSTGIYRTVTSIPETVEEQIANWEGFGSVDDDLNTMENGAWIVIIGEGHLLYDPRRSAPDSAPNAVKDAREVLLRVRCVRDYRSEGHIENALWNAIRAASHFEMMRVRPFEPVVIRGAKTGPRAGRKGAQDRWAPTEKLRKRKRELVLRMIREHQNKAPRPLLEETYAAVARAYNAAYPREKKLTPEMVKWYRIQSLNPEA